MTEFATADAAYVLNYYLYGQSDNPSDLTHESFIRSGESTTTIAVTGSTYMAKLGRFALPSTFDIVEAFFSNDTSISPKYNAQGQVTFYSEAELRVLLGITQALKVVEQYKFVDSQSDYAERTLIWNSTVFEIADTSQFWVRSGNVREIENFAVVPFQGDNFDLNSDSIPTQIANISYLQSRLDPFNIGRRVDIQIVDDVARQTYSLEDFTRDSRVETSWSFPSVGSAFASVQSIVDKLNSDNVVSPVNSNGLPIVYGTVEDDSLSPASIVGKPLYSNIPVPGLAFVGGSGRDTVDYSQTIGVIRISFENDALSISRAGLRDALHGIEVVKATPGRDTLTLIGAIPLATNLTIDANGGQGPNPRDTINTAKAGLGGVDIFIDPASGAGYVMSKATTGKIDLVGFHTGIVGSDYDDTITDLSSGEKMIDAGRGDDIITVGDASQVWGGDGNDVITGSDANDTIYGGNGNNTLLGGAGADKIVVVGDTWNHYYDEDVNTVDAGDGNDWIELRGYVDSLDGGAGNDVFEFRSAISFGRPSTSVVANIRFGVGSGHDMILDHITTPGFSATINLDLSSLSKGDVSFVWDRSEPVEGFRSTGDSSPNLVAVGDLAMIINATGDSIVIPNVSGTLHEWDQDQFWYLGFDPLFSDGYISDTYSWGGAPLGYNGQLSFGSVAAYSTAQQDYLSDVANDGLNPPTDGDDSLSGNGGSESVDGGAGDDTLEESAGSDVFNGGAGVDTVLLRGGAADYRFERLQNGDVRIRAVSGEGADLTTSNVEQISFMADSTDVGLDLLAGAMGTAGNDVVSSALSNVSLFGLAGDDAFNILGGPTMVDGGEGDDLVILRGTPGSYGISVGQDGSVSMIDPVGGGSLLFQRAHDGSVRIQDRSDADYSLVVKNVEAIGFAGSADQFSIDELAGQYGSGGGDTLNGTAWANTLYGLAGSDVINWSSGEDQVDGGEDIDTFVAPNAILDYHVYKDLNGSIVVSSVDGLGETILKNVEWLHFDGGTTILAASQILPLPLKGTDDIDYISGTEGNDRIDGKQGGDGIDGLAGSDSFIWRLGDGNDYISDWSENPVDVDQLNLSDTSISDVLLSNNYGDLVIDVLSTGERITINGQFYADGIGIEKISFNDGTEWDRQDIDALANQGARQVFSSEGSLDAPTYSEGPLNYSHMLVENSVDLLMPVF